MLAAKWNIYSLPFCVENSEKFMPNVSYDCFAGDQFVCYYESTATPNKVTNYDYKEHALK